RGIDVSGITHDINYDMPATREDYVHRVGRTARAGASGVGVTFVLGEQAREFAGMVGGLGLHRELELAGVPSQSGAPLAQPQLAPLTRAGRLVAHEPAPSRPGRTLRGMADVLPPVRKILADRAGEEMTLNDSHLNPQLGRIVRTLGLDKHWVSGEGAHLIDAEGNRYLDLLSGYGVFAIGRNHPEAIAAVRETMEAHTANLPQLGVTLLSGVLAEQLLARAPGSVAAM